MKKLEWVFALIITLAIIFMVYSANQTQKQVLLHNQQNNVLKRQIEALPLKIDINKELVTEIKSLTRENEQLITENRALKDYIKGFDGFWKE
jgi:CHASE1-domain containing sensor protein